MKHLLILSLAIGMLLLFGCAGEQPGNSPPPSPPSGGNTAPPAPPSGGNAQQSAADQLASFFGMHSTLQYKATYNVVANSGGQQTSMQTTQYVKGTGKMRSDGTYQGMETRTYVVDKEAVSCSQAQGAWTCLKLPLQEDSATQATQDIESHLADYQVAADGTMNVAGATAACFKVAGKGIEYYRQCISPDGVPLYLKIQGGSGTQSYTTEMTATSYSKSVADSDFVPPATPSEMPPIGGGPGNTNVDPCESACGSLTGDMHSQCMASCQSFG